MWGEFAQQTKQVGRMCAVDSLETRDSVWAPHSLPGGFPVPGPEAPAALLPGLGILQNISECSREIALLSIQLS